MARSGYWMVGSDGTIHSFGDVRHLGHAPVGSAQAVDLESTGTGNLPQSPQEVAEALAHMRGIPWHQAQLQSKKDDWVTPLADALVTMYASKGTTGGKKYTLNLHKRDSAGNVIDNFTLEAFGWV